MSPLDSMHHRSISISTLLLLLSLYFQVQAQHEARARPDPIYDPLGLRIRLGEAFRNAFPRGFPFNGRPTSVPAYGVPTVPTYVPPPPPGQYNTVPVVSTSIQSVPRSSVDTAPSTSLSSTSSLLPATSISLSTATGSTDLTFTVSSTSPPISSPTTTFALTCPDGGSAILVPTVLTRVSSVLVSYYSTIFSLETVFGGGCVSTASSMISSQYSSLGTGTDTATPVLPTSSSDASISLTTETTATLSSLNTPMSIMSTSSPLSSSSDSIPTPMPTSSVSVQSTTSLPYSIPDLSSLISSLLYIWMPSTSSTTVPSTISTTLTSMSSSMSMSSSESLSAAVSTTSVETSSATSSPFSDSSTISTTTSMMTVPSSSTSSPDTQMTIISSSSSLLDSSTLLPTTLSSTVSQPSSSSSSEVSSTSTSGLACGTITDGFTITYTEASPQVSGFLAPDFRPRLSNTLFEASISSKSSAENECQHLCDLDARCQSWVVGFNRLYNQWMCVLFGTPLDPRTFDEGPMTITDGAAFNGRCPGTMTINVPVSTSMDMMTTGSSASSGPSMSASMPTMTSMPSSSLSTMSSSVSSDGCGTVTGGYTLTYSEIAPQLTGNVLPDLGQVLVYKIPTAPLDNRPLAEYQCQQFCDEDTRCVSWFVGYATAYKIWNCLLFANSLQPEAFTSGQGAVLSGAAFDGKCSSTTFSSVVTSTTLVTSTSVPDPVTSSSSEEAATSTQSMEVSSMSSMSESWPATCTPAPPATTGAYTFQFAEVLKPTAAAGVNYTLDFSWASGVVPGTTNTNLPETSQIEAEKVCNDFCDRPDCLSWFMGYAPARSRWQCFYIQALATPNRWVVDLAESPRYRQTVMFARTCK